MNVRRLIQTTVVASLPAVTGACGFVLVNGPPANHEQLDYIPCTESNAGPIIDAVWAGLNVYSSIVLAADPDEYLYYSGIDEGAAIGIMAAEAVVWGCASVVGFGKTKRCRGARQQLAARNAQLLNVGRPEAGGATARAVVISPSAYTLTVGQTIQLVAAAMSSSGTAIANREFVWSSSNSAIASVSNTGFVTAHSAGSVIIAATTENVTGTAQITISRQD